MVVAATASVGVVAQSGPDATVQHKTISAADCTAERLGTSAAAWVEAVNGVPAHCRVDGAIAPVSTDPTARPINFRVILPAAWNRRAVQLGGGMNGIIPNLTGAAPVAPSPSLLERGLVTYGSDSWHQMAFGRGRGAAPPGVNYGDDWALNDEAVANLGHAQMKKTHDAAMVLIERMYGERPRFNYYIGTSQGGREALTVSQRYPADYDGVAANVPILGFSSRSGPATAAASYACSTP
jgi:feruloyl esterase